MTDNENKNLLANVGDPEDFHLTFLSDVRSFRRVVWLVARYLKAHGDKDSAEALFKQVNKIWPRINKYQETLVQALASTNTGEPGSPKPQQMILYCPVCHKQHIDEGVWALRPHKTHLCQFCEQEWKPAMVPTVGVAHLNPSKKED